MTESNKRSSLLRGWISYNYSLENLTTGQIFVQLGFYVSNWQKVQLNTDLFLDTQKYLYRIGEALLKQD
jgi:hypothetical protein